MIVEIEPYVSKACSPPKYTLWYKNDGETYYRHLCLGYFEVKQFLETYGYETNNLIELIKFGINAANIVENKNL